MGWPPADEELTIKLHLHSLAVERFLARRIVACRFAFTLWVVLVGLGVALRDVSHENYVEVIAITVAISAVTFHSLFQWKYVYRQMRRDWRQGRELDDEFRRRVLMDTQQWSDDDYKPFWAHGWQVLVTLVVATIVALTILV